MGFLSPLFLVGALAAAIPVVLHLLRHHDGPVVPFSALRFVPKVAVRSTRRRRLDDRLLLALRVAALVCLALAFARPYFAAPAGTPEADLTVIAIDRSFSMSAPGLMDRARALALEAAHELPQRQRAALVAFDERAEVVLTPTTDRAALRTAIADVTSGYRGTRFDAPLLAAAELAAGRPARVIVVSDLQRRGWPAALPVRIPESIQLEARAVAPPPENLLAAAVRRTDRGVAAEIRSSAPDARTARVVLSLDGRAALERRAVIPSHGAAEVEFESRIPPGTAVSVAVDDETGYVADNVRYAVFDGSHRRRLLAIVNPGSTGDALYLTRALAAAEGDEGLTIEPVSADRLADTALEGYAGIVFLGARGFDARAGQKVGEAIDRGVGVLIVAGPALDWPWLAAQLPPAVRVPAAGVETAAVPAAMAAADIRHPVFHAAGVDSGWIGGAGFRRMVRLTPRADDRVVARFTNGAPALIELDGSAGKVLAMASDLSNEWNDFGRQPAFVPFVHALMYYVAGGRAEPTEVMVGSRPGPHWERPGVVAGGEAPGAAKVAVNVDLRESDSARLTEAAFAASVERHGPPAAQAARRAAAVREEQQSWWWYVLLLMLAGLVAESVVGRGGRSEARA